MSFSDDMFALLKTDDWQACHRRIDKEEPGSDQETRFSIAHWRSAVFKCQGRYDDASRILDAARADFFSQCGYLYRRAELLCKMGKFAEAIETLRNAPFGAEIDTFPALTYEAIFLLLLSPEEKRPGAAAEPCRSAAGRFCHANLGREEGRNSRPFAAGKRPRLSGRAPTKRCS